MIQDVVTELWNLTIELSNTLRRITIHRVVFCLRLAPNHFGVGARHVLGVWSQWGNCQMHRAHRPRRLRARMRTQAHKQDQLGERLLKDSDSRNNNKEGYKQNRRCSPRLSQRAACMTSGYVAPTCELAPSLGQCAAPTLPGPKTLNWAWAQGLLVGGGALNASSPVGTLLVLLPHLLCPTADQHDLGQLYTAP